MAQDDKKKLEVGLCLTIENKLKIDNYQLTTNN